MRRTLISCTAVAVLVWTELSTGARNNESPRLDSQELINCRGGVYPNAVPTWSDLIIATNNSVTNLVDPITSGSTVLKVISGATFKAPTVVTVDNEIIKVCTVSGNLLYVCPSGRGFDLSGAASHSGGSKVQRLNTAYDHNRLGSEIIAISNALGASLSKVALADHTHPLSSLAGQIVNGQLATGIDAAKLSDGSVSNTEFGFLDGLTGNIQTQLNAAGVSSTTTDNTPDTLVRRDGSGNFSAGTIYGESDGQRHRQCHRKRNRQCQRHSGLGHKLYRIPGRQCHRHAGRNRSCDRRRSYCS